MVPSFQNHSLRWDRIAQAETGVFTKFSQPFSVALHASALPYSTSNRLHAFSACASLYTWESGGHHPCAASAYTSISAGRFAFANVSLNTFLSFGDRASSFAAIAIRNCAWLFAASRCGLFG